jgi:hypothetical protein
VSWSFPDEENISALAKNDIKPENAKASARNKRHGKSKGNAVAQLVEALRYKPEGRTFDSRWCHFSLTKSSRAHSMS